MRRMRGFTLVEVLVALFVMALLAVLSWRGLDGMVRAQEQTRARSDEVLTLQVGLQQWAADLDAIVQLPQTNALEWNGRVLRLTRRSTAAASDGLLVVGWTRRTVGDRTMWLRWQSPVVRTRGELDDAWQQADVWSQNPGEDLMRREVAIIPLDDWQIYFFRENAWTNPQSSDTATATILPAAAGAPPRAEPVLPDGVRVVLSLPPGQAVSGTITRDWVRPTVSGGKSS